MATEKVEQERTISGKGVFRIDEDFKECRRIYLYCSVLRPPSSEYLNVRWNPGKGFYANVTFLFKGYVAQDLAVNFPEQRFLIHFNDSQQVGASLVCALDNILDSFVQYAQARGIPYIKNNSIKDFTYSGFDLDEVKFVCYGGCALSLRLVGEETEKCREGDAPAQPPPPPPPPSQEPVPPGTSVMVDPPYEDEDPENPDTDPDPIDEDLPPTPCVQRGLRYTFINAEFPAPGLTAVAPFEGDLEDIVTSPGDNPSSENIGFIAGETVNGMCVPGKFYSLFQNVSLPYSFVIDEIIDV